MTNNNIIPESLMGEVWPSAMPGDSSMDLGSATMEPIEPIEVRSFNTFKVRYVVGRFGLDDTGGIKVVQRFMNDGGRWQTEDPLAMNYVTARASNGVSLKLYPEQLGHQRPWDRSLRVLVSKGFMQEGDVIEIIFGDKSQGGPGLRAQTFCESAHEFRVLVDACATGHFLPLLNRLSVGILPGKPHTWRAILPTLRKPGSSFKLGVRADDFWGNPSDQIDQELFLFAEGPVENLPESIRFCPGDRCVHIDDLSANDEGVIRIYVKDKEGNELTQSNPLVIKNGACEAFWADLHGQSGETVGTNPIKEYFHFGRDLAMLDIVCHQANDFQIKDDFWQEINKISAELNKDHEFLVFPGYEWSGNSPTGGDHNVLFIEQDRPIYRSSRALLTNNNLNENDANTTRDLFHKLESEDVVVFAHIGGRPANIAQADGGHIRTALEVHSDWGTFEWIMNDSFELGYRHGLVANSDGHKGRPGASHPGAASFGAFGGITCFYTPQLTRKGIFESFRRRHHYGTTGARMFIDVNVAFENDVNIYLRDPRNDETAIEVSKKCVMGDIVKTQDTHGRVSVETYTQSPILSVSLLKGAEITEVRRPYEKAELGKRIRVTFHGAEYRGRGRETRWKGAVDFDHASIQRFQKINAWNHDRMLDKTDNSKVDFDFLTTGNFVGFEVWLDDLEAQTLSFTTDHVSGKVDLSSLGLEPQVFEAGGLDRKVTIVRLPDEMNQRSFSPEFDISLFDQGDTPIWTKIETEDGHIGWSSPVYTFK